MIGGTQRHGEAPVGAWGGGRDRSILAVDESVSLAPQAIYFPLAEALGIGCTLIGRSGRHGLAAVRTRRLRADAAVLAIDQRLVLAPQAILFSLAKGVTGWRHIATLLAVLTGKGLVADQIGLRDFGESIKIDRGRPDGGALLELKMQMDTCAVSGGTNGPQGLTRADGLAGRDRNGSGRQVVVHGMHAAPMVDDDGVAPTTIVFGGFTAITPSGDVSFDVNDRAVKGRDGLAPGGPAAKVDRIGHIGVGVAVPIAFAAGKFRRPTLGDHVLIAVGHGHVKGESKCGGRLCRRKNAGRRWPLKMFRVSLFGRCTPETQEYTHRQP